MAFVHGRMHMLIIHLSLLLMTVMLGSAQQPRPAVCSDRCGGVEIPHPFGIEPGCYMEVPGQDEQQFKVTCDEATKPPLLRFLNGDTLNYTITNISADASEMHVMLPTSRNCYINNSYDKSLYRHSELILPSGYTISDENAVYIIGCNKIVLYQGFVSQVDQVIEETEKLGTSGVALCQDLLGQIPSNNCSGIGCTKNSIIKGLHNITLDVWTIGAGLGSTEQWGLDYPCSYGFIVDDRNFTFNGNETFKMFDTSYRTTRPELPVAVDWAIGKDNCEAASNNQSSYACKAANTECVNGSSGGYICRCKDGYHGNPYVLDGCQDINECTANKLTAICHATAISCENSVGTYSCKCPQGQTNGGKNSDPCVKAIGKDKAMQISLGVCLSFVAILVVTFWIYCGMKRRKFRQLKEKYFKDNGGFLLQQRLENFDGPQAAKIFTKEELNTATKNFNDSGKIGEGGYGFVYKGTLPNKKEVAIKVSKSNAPITQSNQFINEVIVLSQINHRNVVRLLGCCLETQTPLLVYEFVSNGNLYEHVHKMNGKGPLSFGFRMKIAAETAGSLAYLHYYTSMQIVHRDVKAANILLDENFTAKVSDFGASKLIPEDQNNLSTLVQGTQGYLDPEYLQSNTLTEKSDVYSFGVVLVELITSQMAISNKKPEAERNLAYFFVKSMEENGELAQIIDHEIIKEGSFEIAEQVAHLAKRCLSLKGGDRPTMKEVAMELEGILAVMGKHPGGKPDSSPKETDYLLAASPSN